MFPNIEVQRSFLSERTSYKHESSVLEIYRSNILQVTHILLFRLILITEDRDSS